MKVLHFKRDDGGCGYYRGILPLKTAAEAGGFELKIIDRGDNAEKIQSAINWCDVAMIPRISEPEMLKLIRWFHDQGKKVILDWDDDPFSVSPLSEHYKHFGILPYAIENDGVNFEWEDGKNINFRENMNRLECARQALSMADMVTVTTDILAETFRPFNSVIRVLPNCIDMQRWEKLPLKREENAPIRMGWFGGHSHYEDWVVIQDAVRTILKKHSNLTMVVFGQLFQGAFQGVSSAQLEHHAWEHIQAYPFKARTLDLDFAIIPLDDTPFNRNKSPIKWIEQGAMRVPCVASYVSPYSEVMDLVPDNGLFIHNNTTEEWVAGMETLINDADLRRRLSDAAEKTVAQHFNIRQQHHLWTNAYAEAQATVPRKLQIIKPKVFFKGVAVE